MIGAAVDVLGHHCDDIVSTLYVETYNGGDCSIWLRHKPVLSVESVQDNSGYITYDLAFQDITAVTVSSSGSEGGASATSIFAYSLDDAETGQVTRRTIGNSITRFSPGVRNVSVIYHAGRTAPYPPAIVLAVKSLVSHWWQSEEMRSVSLGGENVQYDVVNQTVGVARHDGGYTMVAGVPNRILELVMAHRRDVIFA